MYFLNMLFKRKEKEEVSLKDLVNKEFVEKIQPKGGISFKDEKHIKYGNGYSQCVSIVEYPNDFAYLWRSTLTNIDKAIIVSSFNKEEQHIAEENINRSIENTQSIALTEKKQGYKDKFNSNSELLRNVRSAIDDNQALIKMNTKVYLSEKSINELDNVTADLIQYFEKNNFKATVLLNENKNDYLSMFLTDEEQKRLINYREGQVFLSGQIAAGYNYNYSNLNDKYGRLYGYTSCGGSVRLDIGQIDNINRFNYNFAILGNSGSGKSTMSKDLLEDRFARGDNFRIIDPLGEYTTLVNELGGKVIKFTASYDPDSDVDSGIINPLEILNSVDNNIENYKIHLNNFATFMKFIRPSMHEDDISILNIYLDKFYKHYGLNYEDDIVTGLSPEKYPILSDFIEFIQDILYTDKKHSEFNNNISDKVQKSLESLELTLSSLIQTYGSIFNGHSTFKDLVNYPIISFDISALKKVDSNIFDARFYNILTLVWDNALKEGAKMKEKYENHEIKEYQIKRNFIVIDEAHLFLNAKKSYAVDFLLRCEKEGRKFFTGIGIITQSLRDMIPAKTTSEEQAGIVGMLEETTLRFIYKQDANITSLLEQTFEGQLSQSELSRIPFFQKGDLLLSIKGGNNIEFHHYVSDKKLKYFKGGM
ncbi:VirB4 family type IV secretion system protein [Anaerofustis sp. HA2171]|uniref:VirB4 family type IV secretion system protein n=1 Tax=Anaerofustis butyriciformans TaxID=3108533 RepID=UPI002E351B2B|nr:DUF87 domain-containing protein [Anaerofustis sp. HA2171]